MATSVAVPIMKPLSLSSKPTLAHYTWTQQPTFLFASLCTVRLCIWECQQEMTGLEGKESTSSFVFASGASDLPPVPTGLLFIGYGFTRKQFLWGTIINYLFSATCGVSPVNPDTSTRMCPWKSWQLSTSCSAAPISWFTMLLKRSRPSEFLWTTLWQRAEKLKQPCCPPVKARNYLLHFLKGFEKDTFAMITCWSDLEKTDRAPRWQSEQPLG